MKVLFLHGWRSVVGGVKPTFLASRGHQVANPALPDDDFPAAVAIAEQQFAEQAPDVIVGSSRGGAVAMNMRSGKTPLVLLCPAWKRYGAATTVQANTIILHSRLDDTIPYSDSEELARASGLPAENLITVGDDHRLADSQSLEAMLLACQRLAPEIRFQEAIPILRIFEVQKAKEFYAGFLGFSVDWEHRFDAQAPVYMQVSRNGLTLHLSEHHGDCCPGSTVFVWMTGIDAFHREVTSRGYGFMRPGVETTFYGARCMEVIDPFHNRIRFHERLPQGAEAKS